MASVGATSGRTPQEPGPGEAPTSLPSLAPVPGFGEGEEEEEEEPAEVGAGVMWGAGEQELETGEGELIGTSDC